MSCGSKVFLECLLFISRPVPLFAFRLSDYVSSIAQLSVTYAEKSLIYSPLANQVRHELGILESWDPVGFHAAWLPYELRSALDLNDRDRLVYFGFTSGSKYIFDIEGLDSNWLIELGLLRGNV